MARWRRPGAVEMLLVFALLNVICLIVGMFGHLRGMRDPDLVWCAVALAGACQVALGGRIARMVLIVLSCLSYLAAVLSLARSWGLAVMILVVLYAVQIALLVSPPVFGRTRRPQVTVRANGWTGLVPRPPAWLLPWGLFLGIVLTLLYLGDVGFVTAPGCKPATSPACKVFASGYPVRWLTRLGTNGDPAGTINAYALVKDCVQWMLACSSALYLTWIWLTSPTGLRETA